MEEYRPPLDYGWISIKWLVYVLGWFGVAVLVIAELSNLKFLANCIAMQGPQHILLKIWKFVLRRDFKSYGFVLR